MTPHDLLDRAYAALAPYGAERFDKLTNHAPMAAEALFRLGRGEAALAWTESELENLAPRPARVMAIGDSDWPGAAGDPARFTDWSEFFAQEIESRGPKGALEQWVARLSPGYVSVAVHGTLRTAHAARALSDADTPARRRELADGLALWASFYEPVGNPPRTTREPSLNPADALGEVPLVPADKRRNDGSIMQALTALEHAPGFGEVIGWIGADGDTDALLAEIAAEFAKVFTVHARDPLTVIVFTHAITGAAAARNLAAWLTRETAEKLVRFAWEGGAGLYACYADYDRIGKSPALREPAAREALIDHAITNGDEHVIKLTEACLSFHQLTGHPVFLTPPQIAAGYLKRNMGRP